MILRTASGRFLVSAILVIALLAAAPGYGAGAAGDVTVRLGWVMKGEYAFLFVGKEKGFFRKHGLNVDILEGKGSVAAMESVARKNDTFAYTGGPSYLVARSKGLPLKMVALVIQKGPQVLLSWPNTPVRQPKDLEGRSIILSPGDAFHSLWPAFAAGNRIDRSKVREVVVGVDARAATFLLHRADVTPEFLTAAAYPLEEKAGVGLVKLYLADLGWDTISNGIIVHEDTIREKPDLVRRFVAAALEAFAYTTGHVPDATELVLPRLAGQSRGVVRRQIEAAIQLAHTKRTAGRPLGWSDPEDWKDSLKLMAAGGYSKPNEIKGVYYYFTNVFIPDHQ